MSRLGVLITGFGGPDSLEAVGPFMRNLMKREPSSALVNRVSARYQAIGGASPLTATARAIAQRLAASLERSAGESIPVEVGMLYWRPEIPDALASLAAQGCDKVVLVHLSAFDAKVASGSATEAVRDAAAALGIDVVVAPLFASLDAYTDFFVGAVEEALVSQDGSEGGSVIAFTAHSLPLAELVDDDPYVAGLELTATKIAEKIGLASGHYGAGSELFASFSAFGDSSGARPWFLVFQSKGERPGGWLGPSLEDLIDACAQAGVRGVVASPIGFVTDHMETLYDLDIVTAEYARNSGVLFSRSAVPNDAEAVIEALGEQVLALR